MFSSNTTQTSGGYEIQRSLRFNSADGTYLGRTPASASNRRTWTWSGWVKRSALGTGQLLGADIDPSNRVFFGFDSDHNLQLYAVPGPINVKTSAVFRDFSAWYHVVIALDTTQATGSNRTKIYVNGTQITEFISTTYPTQNMDLAVNAAVNHRIGLESFGSLFNGYMTEINFIDGQALTPSSFGAFDAQTGVWGPTRYAGSYGTNGFYLNFSDNSNTTAATLGKDYSGNGNNWTPNNFSVSAGAGNDSLVDVPTNWGVDTGVGGTVRGNYCTLNPLNSASGITNGNLDFLIANNTAYGSIGFSSGKWYWETTINNKGDNIAPGISPDSITVTDRSYFGTLGSVYCYFSTGIKYNGSSETSYGATFTTGDIIGTAVDLDAGTITFYKNGSSQGTAFTGLTGGFKPQVNGFQSSPSASLNFGQRPFAYTAPSGFKALNTQNLPTPTIGATPATQANQYFTPVLYTGDDTNNRFISAGMTPDWTWIKLRSNISNHELFDTLRGVGAYLSSNTTSVENVAGNVLPNSGPTNNGFKVDFAGFPELNQSGLAYVAWNWKANGAGVTNTAGSITSTVSANTTSGFSVVTWTANGAVSTVGHGLGSVPKMIIFKARNNAQNWYVYHAGLAAPNTNVLLLNDTSAVITGTNLWDSTFPTSSVFTAAGPTFPSTWTYVAYAFAEVPGYSKFGSYTGNGSADGPFCFTGMRPAYVMYKKAGGPDGDWVVLDVKRDPTNVTARYLAPNASQAESNDPPFIDILSNGFKMRRASGGSNENGVLYIFAAFAEFPFKYSLAR
jgi:hypothetical protein